VTPKAGTTHRRWGKIYFWAMTIGTLTALGDLEPFIQKAIHATRGICRSRKNAGACANRGGRLSDKKPCMIPFVIQFKNLYFTQYAAATTNISRAGKTLWNGSSPKCGYHVRMKDKKKTVLSVSRNAKAKLQL
jgi:hypothetical protein